MKKSKRKKPQKKSKKMPDIIDIAGTLGPTDINVLTAREMMDTHYERT